MDSPKNLLADANVCPPGTAVVVPTGDVAPFAARLKVVSDPMRLKILGILAANGAVCACDLEAPLGLSQPTVSHHLRQLFEAGLVTREKRGTWAFYRVDPEALSALGAPLSRLADAATATAESS
ncbi:metalloregulator ArsR/SmtB family transcription factor [Demequina sp. B12]|uniref:ArsR/SmtB family transcription factor n=1 Tax=Demequina sp. B12 TaxID=2992757 RepID=UPI00237A6172|nr:metalloregulator ArsR/SmtB family transcription factor [Demequina sp. B12]MDE0573087.1 metalloregulator ArsR/SmtB family transcription factor [Demequina sp. B12]